MSPPLIIASIVAALGTIFPAKGNKNGSSTSAAKRVEIMGGDAMFFSGVVVGVGMSWLITSEMRRTRILERIQLWMWTWIDHDDSSNATTLRSLKDPTNALEIPSTSMGEDGSRLCTLVSPKSTISSSMHTAVLTLASGSQMAPRRAQGMELYYVISGVGTLCKADNKGDTINTLVVSKGQVVVVEPWCSRWMSNRGLQELVFMRTSDGGVKYMKEAYDVVGTEESQSWNAVRLFKSGANYLSSTIRGFRAKESPSGQGDD